MRLLPSQTAGRKARYQPATVQADPNQRANISASMKASVTTVLKTGADQS